MHFFLIKFSKHICAIFTSFSFAPLVLTSFLSLLISVQEQQCEMINVGGSNGSSDEEYERQMDEALEAYTEGEIDRLLQRARRHFDLHPLSTAEQ